RKILAVNFQDRNVRLWIRADDVGLKLALVRERDANVRGAIDDVIVREDVAFGADDYARTERLLAGIFGSPRPTIAVLSKELTEHGIHGHLFRRFAAVVDDFR